MKVRFSKRFLKQYESAPLGTRELFEIRLKTFFRDKYDPTLNNHCLRGRMKKYRSINIGGDWRAIFEEEESGGVIFMLLGTHSQLYK